MVITRFSQKSSVKIKKERDINERILVGTLGVNCLEYTRRCISSLQTRAKHVTFLYIDNGSKESNVQEIKTWKKNNENIDEFLKAFNGSNAGVSVGWNQIIRFGESRQYDKILICNNDIAFGQYTIDGMIESFNKLRDEIPETVMVTATNQTKNPADLANIKQVWKYHEHPDFSCFMIKPNDLSKKVGMFDSLYDPAFFEDNDMHWRILMSGWKAFGSDYAPYSHIASRTRHGNPDLVSHTRFRQNKINFMTKMKTNSVAQEIAVERYQKWIESNPEMKHPSFLEVMNFCIDEKIIDEKMIKFIKNLNVSNVPMS